MRRVKILNILIALSVILGLIAVILSCTSCNKQLFDTTYKFDEAIIVLSDGTRIEGKVQSWTDFEDGDQIQVKIDDVTYLVHSSNIVLISN